MIDLPVEAAPEADRLVLGVNRARDGERIQALAAAAGVDEAHHLLGHWWDFLLAGRLTRDVARLRARYSPGDHVDAAIDRLVRAGLVREEGLHLSAADGLVEVLDAIGSENARAARRAWEAWRDEVATASDGAARMIEAADDDAPVVAAHRELPLPDDEFLRLYDRLVTVRYIRQHDHAAAWAQHGLTADVMRAYTAMWMGEDGGSDPAALADLVERGIADPSGSLTAMGRTLREQIEDDTIARSHRTYDVLGSDGPAYLEALRRLPTPS